MIQFSTALFDLDGTLWDSESAFVETLKNILENSTEESITQREIRKRLRRNTPLYVLDEFSPFSRHLFWSEYKKNYHLVRLFFENTHTILRELLKRGKRLGVVTSLKKPITIDLLSRFALIDFMSVIITPSDTRARKPSPIPIRKATAALKADSNRTLYLGNSDPDIVAAKMAGCISGLAKWGATQPILETPHHEFSRLEELLAKGR